jgi:hypothetical protein
MSKDLDDLVDHIKLMEKQGLTVPKELFTGTLYVLEFGANKYAANNWLLPDGVNSDHKSMYGSIFRHVAEAYAGKEHDPESRLHPAMHAQARLGMMLARKVRGL